MSDARDDRIRDLDPEPVMAVVNLSDRDANVMNNRTMVGLTIRSCDLGPQTTCVQFWRKETAQRLVRQDRGKLALLSQEKGNQLLKRARELDSFQQACKELGHQFRRIAETKRDVKIRAALVAHIGRQSGLTEDRLPRDISVLKQIAADPGRQLEILEGGLVDAPSAAPPPSASERIESQGDAEAQAAAEAKSRAILEQQIRAHGAEPVEGSLKQLQRQLATISTARRGATLREQAV